MRTYLTVAVLAGLHIAPRPAAAQLGACCVPAGNCYELDEEPCDQLGGVFQGYGTTCPVNCGACCATVGFCVVTGEDNCLAVFLGLHQGEGTTCDSVSCPQPFTRITYQGQLKAGGVPVQGHADLKFGLWDAVTGGTPMADEHEFPTTMIQNGLFTVDLDFGINAWRGGKYWIEVAARMPEGSGEYTILSPRQEVMPVPMAYSLPGLYTEQHIVSPNIVAGWSGNAVAFGVAGGAISGGGSPPTSASDTVSPNMVWDNFGTVGGGTGNQAGDGDFNSVNAPCATVGGGKRNVAGGAFSTVPGGFGNAANGQYSYAAGRGAKVRSAADVGGGDEDGDEGTFVWADSTDGDFISTGPNQFLIRASGGVGIGADSPEAALHVEDWSGTGAIRAISPGIPVYAHRNEPSDSLPAIDAMSDSSEPEASAVRGKITDPFSGESSAGVHGINANEGVNGAGVRGTHEGNGAGVFGESLGEAGTGIYGISNVTGVHGVGYPLSGVNYGVKGETHSPGGYAGYFTGGRNYFEGYVGIGVDSPEHPLQVGTNENNGNGAHVTVGGVWTNGSDRNSKEGFEPVDKRAILAKVADLPVTGWRYKSENDGTRHIGPTAQDFHAAFGLGSSHRHIGTLDADGVALAAIQGLHQILKEKDAEIETLRAKSVALRARVESLERMMAELASSAKGGAR